MPAKNRPLSSRNREKLRANFTAHLRLTNDAESFEGVSLTGIHPDADFDLLRQFSVDSKKKKDSRVRCSFCSPKSGKWLHNGWLAYFPEDKKLRFIGPDCGANHLTKFDEVKAERAREIQDDRRRDFVNDNAPSIAALFEHLPRLIQAADDLETFQRILKNKAPAAFAELRKIAPSGELPKIIYEEVQDLRGGAVKRDLLRRQVKFAEFHGAPLFAKDLEIALRLRNALRTLQRYAPDAALAAINRGDEDAHAFATYWTDVFRKSRKQVEIMQDIMTFFSPHSLSLLSSWADEGHSSNRISANFSQGVFQLRDERADALLVRYTVPTSLDVLKQKLPELVRKTG